MILPRSVLLSLLDYEVHVTEWGDRSNPPIVLWHGLARTGRDFDELAEDLARDYFVLCPDTIGRGLSSWAEDPDSEYCLKNYASIAIAMLDHYNIGHVRWLGTSMGGLIGIYLASGNTAERISTLLLNDIGPEIPGEAMDRILTYAGQLPVFSTITEADRWLRVTYAPFGPAQEAFWSRMALKSTRRKDDGQITLHYDPKIVRQISANAEDFLIWERYNEIRQPTRIVWGAKSDVLTKPILDRMLKNGPRAEISVIEDCGHAPTLSRADDIKMVRNFFE